MPANQVPADTALAAARTAVAGLIAASGGEASVAWRPLEAADSRPAGQLLINAETRFHAASMMKVPVMIELFRQADSGELRLDDRLLVANEFHSLADGSPYALSAADDSDADLYKAVGQALPLRGLCEAMITRSSNLAANLLIERLGPRRIQSTADGLGAAGIQVVRGVEDQKAFDKGLNNTTDATALLTLFWKLGRGEVVSRAASAAMIDILKRQTLNDGIPAGLPPGTVVAHKTGSITAVQHDGGVVFAPHPYALVVLTRGIQDEKRSARLIADITRVVDALAR